MKNLISPYIVGTIAFSNVSRQPPDDNYIIEKLINFDKLETLRVLSRFNLLLFNMDFAVNLYNQKMLCEEFLNNYYRDKVYKKLSSNNIIFHRSQILYLIRKAFLHCIEKKNFSFEYPGNKQILGTCCLIANNFIYFPHKSDSIVERMSDFNKKQYLWRHSLPSYEIYNPPKIKHEIVRNLHIYKSFLIKINDLKYINDALLEITSVSLDDYLNIIFSIVALFLQRRENILSRGKTYIVKDELLANTNLNADSVSKIFSLISLDFYKYKKEICYAGEEKNPFNFITFKKYPLVRINEKFICIDLNFVNDKISSGLFWLINNSIISRAQRDKFHSDWGFLFEEYIKSVFRRYFAEDKYYFNPKYDNSDDEVADTIYIDKEILVLFEHKFTVLSSKAKYEQDTNYLIEEIKSKFIQNKKGEWKGIGQIANNINKLFSKNKSISCKKININKINRIFPILIVNENMLNSPYSNFMFNNEFKSLIKISQLIDKLEIMSLLVITVEDFERLEALISRYQFIEIISKKCKEDPNLNYSFSDYLDNMLNLNPDLRTEYIDMKYREWADSAIKNVFDY